MRAALLILLLLGSAALPAGDTYTWTDENNERHWSDTPHPGAQKVELIPQNVVRMPPPPRSTSPPPPLASARPAYAGCAIAQPTTDQVFFDIQSLTISVRVEPALHAGDSVAASMDGTAIPSSGPAAMEFTVTPIYRGTHTAAAVIRDSSGRTLCTAQSVTFHVRQHAIGNRPRVTPH